MAQDDQLVILGISVHAVVGLDVGRLVDGVFGIVEVLLPEDLHGRPIIIYFIRPIHTRIPYPQCIHTHISDLERKDAQKFTLEG